MGTQINISSKNGRIGPNRALKPDPFKAHIIFKGPLSGPARPIFTMSGPVLRLLGPLNTPTSSEHIYNMIRAQLIR